MTISDGYTSSIRKLPALLAAARRYGAVVYSNEKQKLVTLADANRDLAWLRERDMQEEFAQQHYDLIVAEYLWPVAKTAGFERKKYNMVKTTGDQVCSIRFPFLEFDATMGIHLSVGFLSVRDFLNEFNRSRQEPRAIVKHEPDHVMCDIGQLRPDGGVLRWKLGPEDTGDVGRHAATTLQQWLPVMRSRYDRIETVIEYWRKSDRNTLKIAAATWALNRRPEAFAMVRERIEFPLAEQKRKYFPPQHQRENRSAIFSSIFGVSPVVM